MPYLNADVPEWTCYVRSEFLHDLRSHHGEHERVAVFGLASIPGRALTWHVLTEAGAQFARVPLHALCAHPDAPPRPLGELQLWNCFAYDVSVHEFGLLAEKRVWYRGKDGTWHRGAYMFTVDWCGSTAAESAGDLGHKSAHVIALDDGNYAAQPNNRCRWFDPAFVTKPFPAKPTYVTSTRTWSVEATDTERSEDSDAWAYETVGIGPSGSVTERRCPHGEDRFRAVCEQCRAASKTSTTVVVPPDPPIAFTVETVAARRRVAQPPAFSQTRPQTKKKRRR